MFHSKLRLRRVLWCSWWCHKGATVPLWNHNEADSLKSFIEPECFLLAKGQHLPIQDAFISLFVLQADVSSAPAAQRQTFSLTSEVFSAAADVSCDVSHYLVPAERRGGGVGGGRGGGRVVLFDRGVASHRRRRLTQMRPAAAPFFPLLSVLYSSSLLSSFSFNLSASLLMWNPS